MPNASEIHEYADFTPPTIASKPSRQSGLELEGSAYEPFSLLVLELAQISDFEFQISDLKFQISDSPKRPSIP